MFLSWCSCFDNPVIGTHSQRCVRGQKLATRQLRYVKCYPALTTGMKEVRLKFDRLELTTSHGGESA